MLIVPSAFTFALLFPNLSTIISPTSIYPSFIKFPKGTLGFLDIETPVFADATASEPSAWEKKPRWVFDQDTGGAIRGGGPSAASLYAEGIDSAADATNGAPGSLGAGGGGSGGQGRAGGTGGNGYVLVEYA